MSQKKTEISQEMLDTILPSFHRKWEERITGLPLDETKLPAAVEWLYKQIDKATPPIYVAESPAHAVLINQNLWNKIEGKPEQTKIDPAGRMPEFVGYGNVSDYGWASYYDFVDAQGGEVSDDFRAYRDIYMAAGIYDAVAYDEAFIAVKKPIAVFFNDNDRLHNLTGPAIAWADGFGVYMINGRMIEPQLFKSALSGSITKEEFLAMDNDEHRSAVIMVMGSERLSKMMGAVLVDSVEVSHNVSTPVVTESGVEMQQTVETEVIGLYKTPGNDNKILKEPFAWITRKCPSTGTMYWTPSNPVHKTAMDAAKAHRPEWVPNTMKYAWTSRS